MDKKYIELITEDGSMINVSEDDDIPFNLTYALLDLQFLDKRSGSFSNIFKLPATKANSLKFKHYSNSQITYPQSNSFLNQERLQIIANGTNIFNGFIRGISSSKKLTPEAFEAQVIGNNLEWADALGNMPLNSLTYPTVNYDINTVRSSWNNTYLDGYVAPLASYGRPENFTYGESKGTTIVYPDGSPNYFNNNFGSSYKQYILQWKYTDFRYWHFIRPLVFEMFEKSGYRLVSNFLSSAEASKFIMYINDFDAYQADEQGVFPSSINLGTDLIKIERKCIDLIRGLQNMFNLFFTTDEKTKTVYCEPFDEFIKLYELPIEWSEKIDYQKEWKTNQFTDKKENLIFKYKPDSISNQLVSFKEKLDIFRTPDNYIGGIIYPQYNSKKEYENSFFEGYMMGGVNCAWSFYAGVPFNGTQDKGQYLYFSGRALGGNLDILMPCIWPDKWIEDNDIAVSGSPGNFINIRSLPEAKGNVEPKFAYYAGMTFIESMMNSNRFHSGINGFKFPIDTSIDTDKVPDDWHNIFLYENDALRNERPFAYIIDAFLEDNVNNPKSYCYGNQEIWVYAGAVYQPGAPNWELQYIFTEYPEFKFKGLIEKHYMNFIKSVMFGKKENPFLKITEPDLLKLDFRKKYVLEHSEHILLEISKFNPLINSTTSSLFLELLIADFDDFNNLIYNDLNVIYTHFKRG